MKFWQWEEGRQNTGYKKFLIVAAKWPLPFDVYLLKFEEGVYIPPHVDKLECGQHYRFNLILKKARRGGDFICNPVIYENDRMKYFRSDISEHSVTRVEKGTRYVLSIGWVKIDNR